MKYKPVLCIPLLNKVTWLFISGEFGVVYRACLQWHPDGVTEMVAVKTLKGIPFKNNLYCTYP